MDVSLMDRLAAGENSTTAFFGPALEARAVARTVCAFLNSEGGKLFLGVDEGDIVGLQSSDVAQDARHLELSLKSQISPTPFLSTEVIKDGSKRLVVVDVPRGRDGPYVFDGGVWLRSGKRTKSADVAELRKLLRADAEIERWERRPSPQLTYDDLDFDEVRATVRDAEQRSSFSFTDVDDLPSVLNELSLFRGDSLTNGADALLGRVPGRRHPQCRTQLVVYSTDKSGEIYRDNRWLEGPLVRVCNEALAAIVAATPTRSVFDDQVAKRVDRAAYDFRAIREGIVNAFVHRDYSSYSGGLKVSVYEDRIEIWNSGSLPQGLKPADLPRDHPSILVNPDIAQTFYIRGLMERVGRGTELIALTSRRLGARPPKWQDTRTGVTLTIYAAGEDFASTDLNERQKAVLSFLIGERSISAREYLEQFGDGVTARHARRDLDQLVKLRLLTVTGSGRKTLYRR